MPNDQQRRTYARIREEIAHLRGPNSFVPLSLDKISELADCRNPRSEGYRARIVGTLALFRVDGARVLVEESGEIVADGLLDCRRFASGLLDLPVIAADLLMEDSEHRPILSINSHTPESFTSYLKTGIPLEKARPFPIAIVSRKLGSVATGQREALDRLIDLFDVVVRFAALVLTADYLSVSRRSEARLNEALSRLGHPSLGDWVDLLRAHKQVGHFEGIEALRLDNDWLYAFVKMRNDIVHGATRSEPEYKRMFREHIEPVRELLHKVDDLIGNYWLLKPYWMEDRGTYHRVSVLRLMGDNPYFDARIIRSSKSLPYKVVYLSRNYLSRELDPLVLEPYVILRECEKCNREELFLLDKFSQREITYLGYESGHKMSCKNAEELPSLLRQ
jgi:hypothetical protein